MDYVTEEKHHLAFEGFQVPKANFSPIPHQLIMELPRFETLAELKVVLYVLRHTWGYQDDYKKITLDEFENGRKTKDGNRLDNGVGMSHPSIVSGIKKAVEHNFLYVMTDDSDKARVKKYYSLTEQGLKDLTPDVKKFNGGGKEPLPRTENNTLEKTIEDSLAAMKLAVKTLLKQYNPSQCENVAKSLLGLHSDKKKVFNLDIPITVEDLPTFCAWWDKKKDKSGASLTRPRNMDSILAAVNDWQATKTRKSADSSAARPAQWGFVPDMRSEAEILAEGEQGE